MEAIISTKSTLEPRVISVFLFSYGHANGPIVQPEGQGRLSKLLAYNIRHLRNPPRNLRAKSNGLSKQLQKEFLHNDDVEVVLDKVQSDLVDALREVDSMQSVGAVTGEEENLGEDTSNLKEENSAEDVQDTSVVLTVCCEEGRHRSVAFIEELARRIANLKNGDGISHSWNLIIRVTHRDIEGSVLVSIYTKNTEQNQPMMKMPSRPKRKKTQYKRGRNSDNRGGWKNCESDTTSN